MNLKTAKAYQLKLTLQEFFTTSPDKREAFLRSWYFLATHSKLQPVIEMAKTIKRHWKGIMNFFRSRLNNGIMEAINSLVQAARSRARGYRTVKNFITMIYLIGARLDFSLPLSSVTHTK